MLVLPLAFRGRNTRRLGVAAALAGGALILLEGLLLDVPGFFQLSIAGAVAGGGIIALAIAGESWSRGRRVFGAAILVLSLVSFFGVSGFLFGAFLGSLGGTLIVLTPGFSSTPFRRKSELSSADLGPPCSSCGKHVPPWTSTCPYCGTVASSATG